MPDSISLRLAKLEGLSTSAARLTARPVSQWRRRLLDSDPVARDLANRLNDLLGDTLPETALDHQQWVSAELRRLASTPETWDLTCQLAERMDELERTAR